MNETAAAKAAGACSRPVLGPPLSRKDRLQRSPNCGFIETDCSLNYTVSADTPNSQPSSGCVPAPPRTTP